jgi:hypothetical protein
LHACHGFVIQASTEAGVRGMTGPVPPIGAPQYMQPNGASPQPGSAQPQLVAQYPVIGGSPGPQIMMMPQSTMAIAYPQSPQMTAYAYQGSRQPMAMMPQSSTFQYPGAGCKPPPQTARARPFSAFISLSSHTLSSFSLSGFIKPAMYTNWSLRPWLISSYPPQHCACY